MEVDLLSFYEQQFHLYPPIFVCFQGISFHPKISELPSLSTYFLTSLKWQVLYNLYLTKTLM